MKLLRNVMRRGGRIVLRLVLLVVVPITAAIYGIQLWVASGRYVETENAYVKTNIVAISADVDGRVEWVGVRDNEHVEAGEQLFRLDPRPFELAVTEAEARMEVVRTEVESMRSDYREALVQADEARDNVKFLQRQFQRQEKLRERKLGRAEDYDQAEHDLQMSRRKVRLIEERARRVLAQLGGDADIAVEDHPRYKSAAAVRDQASVDFSRTIVLAPSAGVISNMRLQVGEYVEEGKPIFSLIEDNPIWIEANLKETQLTHVREGLTATIEVDAYPERIWRAEVDAIAPATGAEFALLPPQNATGNWVKVVQRVPVHLEIERVDGAPPLRAGMTATVRIDTEREPEMPAFARRVLEREELPAFLRGMLREAFALTAPRESPTPSPEAGVGSAAAAEMQ